GGVERGGAERGAGRDHRLQGGDLLLVGRVGGGDVERPPVVGGELLDAAVALGEGGVVHRLAEHGGGEPRGRIGEGALADVDHARRRGAAGLLARERRLRRRRGGHVGRLPGR